VNSGSDCQPQYAQTRLPEAHLLFVRRMCRPPDLWPRSRCPHRLGWRCCCAVARRSDPGLTTQSRLRRSPSDPAHRERLAGIVSDGAKGRNRPASAISDLSGSAVNQPEPPHLRHQRYMLDIRAMEHADGLDPSSRLKPTSAIEHRRLRPPGRCTGRAPGCRSTSQRISRASPRCDPDGRTTILGTAQRLIGNGQRSDQALR
jgi:hypothetical protein